MVGKIGMAEWKMGAAMHLILLAYDESNEWEKGERLSSRGDERFIELTLSGKINRIESGGLADFEWIRLEVLNLQALFQWNYHHVQRKRQTDLKVFSVPLRLGKDTCWYDPMFIWRNIGCEMKMQLTKTGYLKI